jgi:hypothetical protein
MLAEKRLVGFLRASGIRSEQAWPLELMRLSAIARHDIPLLPSPSGAADGAHQVTANTGTR